MIYWFTGQPGHGKTTLAQMLFKYLANTIGEQNVFHIDGDDIRRLFDNQDYSISGRVANVGTAQRIAKYLSTKYKVVIVSIVSPYIDQREDFKKAMGNDMLEFYVHSDLPSERESNKAIAYIAPKVNYIDIDTTIDEPEESIQKVITAIIYHIGEVNEKTWSELQDKKNQDV